VSLDKVITKVVLSDAGIPTPGWTVHREPGKPLGRLRFPCVVKPRHESTSLGLHLVRDRAELDAAVGDVVERVEQDALVEQYIDGREICISLLGNEPVSALPPVELDFSSRAFRLVTRGDKFHRSDDTPDRICPAAIAPPLATRLNELAIGTFRAC